jgi:hypothetical protein
LFVYGNFFTCFYLKPLVIIHNSSIIKCQSILKTTTLQSELAFIKANYDFVSKTITSLEVECLPLHESIKIITNFEEKICKVPGKIGQKVKQNFFEIIEKILGITAYERLTEF